MSKTKEKVTILLATFFYTGNFPIGPGTAGTVATLPFVYLLINSNLNILYICITVIITCVSIPICGKAEEIIGKKDASEIVLDEVVGMLIAGLPLIYISEEKFLYSFGVFFILFRLFDIFKPWPINKLQNLKGGMGVVMDDVLAGMFAAVTGFLISHYCL